jgi:hypothetical protein
LTILEQETGIKVFEEFKNRFADPLQMEDFRVRDGYYHFEKDKSIHPAYPFRMSARDMARFGLLFLRKGRWKEKRILSERWIEESTRSYSDAAWGGGYGYMWWVPDAKPFKKLKMYSALGLGQQSIDVIPGAEMVFVLRTNTFENNRVKQEERFTLIRKILKARIFEPKAKPKLVKLPPVPKRFEAVDLTPKEKKALCGECETYFNTTGKINLEEGELIFRTPMLGGFRLIPTGNNRFVLEDVLLELRFHEEDGGARKLVPLNASGG